MRSALWNTTLLAAAVLAAGCGSGDRLPTPREPAAPATAPAQTPTVEENDMNQPAAETRATIVLAGGCFWGMEELLRGIPGVVGTEVGYCGGETGNVTYSVVKTGRTGHAESVRVEYDPSVLPLETLLRDWFFKMHDPTTLNRQGNDIGTQYRSAILWMTEEQREVAERVKAEVDASGKWPNPVVTAIQPAGPWSRAEEEHQDYLQKHPDGYTCHWMRD